MPKPAEVKPMGARTFGMVVSLSSRPGESVTSRLTPTTPVRKQYFPERRVAREGEHFGFA